MSLSFDLTLPRRDFHLKLEGEFENRTIGIFGPSGAGKTSLFSLLAGLERPQSGRIVLNGRVLTDTEKGIHVEVHKRRIGLVFQEKLLFPHMTIEENMRFGEPYAQDPIIGLNEVSDLLGLNTVLKSMPYEVSGGEQQRAAIGRALLSSPEMLLLDEPFSAVDNSLRATILPYLRNLRERLSIPFLLISHDLPDIQRLTDQIYLIDQGRCCGFGNVLDYYGDNYAVSKDSGMVNTFPLSGSEVLPGGLYACTVEACSSLKVIVSTEPRERSSLVVHPGEVALSKNLLDHISIENQIPGTILRIIKTEHHALCLVDVGIRIAAKLSNQTLHNMNLAEGDSVFCLIKALSFRS